jgi:hypothetical protein
MVRSYDIDRFAKHFAAEVFDGHTGCNDVARTAKIGVDSGQIAEHTNSHQVIRYLSVGRPGIQPQSLKRAQKSGRTSSPFVFGLHGRREILFIRRDSQLLGAIMNIVENPTGMTATGQEHRFPAIACHVGFSPSLDRITNGRRCATNGRGLEIWIIREGLRPLAT